MVIWGYSPAGLCVYAYYLERFSFFFSDTFYYFIFILFLQMCNLMSFNQQY